MTNVWGIGDALESDDPRGIDRIAARKRTRDLIRYVVAWVPMLFIAIANGALRQFTFGKVMSELHAHQLSTAIGSVLIGLFVFGVIRAWRPSSARQAVAIGLTWLSLTVMFEFAFGRLVTQRSCSPYVFFSIERRADG